MNQHIDANTETVRHEQHHYYHPTKLEYFDHRYNNKAPSSTVTAKTNNMMMFLDSGTSPSISTKATHSSISSTNSNSSTSTKVIDNCSSVKFSSSVANSNVNHPLLLRRRTSSSLSSTTTTASTTTTTQRSDGIQNPFRDDHLLQHQHNSNNISSRHVLQGAGAGIGLSVERLWIMQPSIATNNDERMEECCCSSSTSAVTTKTTTSHTKKRDLSNSSSSDCQNNGNNNNNKDDDDGDDDLLLLDCAALGSSLKRIKLSPTKSPGELRLSNDLQQLLKDQHSQWMVYHDQGCSSSIFETSQKEWEWICNFDKTMFMARDPVDALRLRIIMFVMMDDPQQQPQQQQHSKWCFWMQFPKMYPHSPPVVYQMTIMEKEESTTTENKQSPLSSISSSTTRTSLTTSEAEQLLVADQNLITHIPLHKLDSIKPPKYGQIHVQQETLPYHHHHHLQQQRQQQPVGEEASSLGNNNRVVCYKYQNWSPIRRLEDLLHWLWTLPSMSSSTNPHDDYGSSSSTSTDSIMMMD